MSLDITQILEQQKMLLETLKPYMEMLGIELYIDRIDIAPEDCPKTCIDYIWRIRCRDEFICKEIKRQIEREQEKESENE